MKYVEVLGHKDLGGIVVDDGVGVWQQPNQSLAMSLSVQKPGPGRK